MNPHVHPHMNPIDPRPALLRTAAYLRCYPHDPWQMSCHQQALREHAAHLGLPEPTVHLDNGYPGDSERPRLSQLMEAVASGLYQVVLIPGPWVFCLDTEQAGAVIRSLTDADCRVIELPARPRPARFS